MDDDRKEKITLNSSARQTGIVEQFERESENPVDMQRAGSQSIMDSLKRYAESH